MTAETWTPERARKLADDSYLRHTNPDEWEAIHDLADALEAQQAELQAARDVIEQMRIMPMFRLTGEGWKLLQLLSEYDALRGEDGK